MAGRLRGLAEELGADEIAVLTTTHDPEARRRSYTLLAEAWDTMAAVPTMAPVRELAMATAR